MSPIQNAAHVTDAPSNVDTMGWHTVAAVRYSDVNAAIEAEGTAPPSFAQQASDGSASAEGTFGHWRLATGGSGKLLKLEIEVTGGTVTISGPNPPSRTISSCVFPVTVEADFIPQPINASVKELRLASGQAVEVGDPTPADPTGSFLHTATLKQLLQDWLTENISEFNAVFSAVEMNAEYEHDGLTWLKPSHIGYAVAEPVSDPTPDNSVFAVLCLIDGDVPPSNLSYQVSHLAIPEGADAAFLISPDKFLQHMIRPALPFMFKDIPAARADDFFEIDNSGRRITNIEAVLLPDTKFPWGPLDLKESTKNPSMQPHQFSCSVEGDLLVLDATEMQFDWGPGQWVKLFYRAQSKLAFREGTHMLTLVTQVQTAHGEVEESWARVIVEIVGIVAGMLGGAAGLVGSLGGKAVSTAAVAGAETSEAVTAGEDLAIAESATSDALAASTAGRAVAATSIGARFRGWTLVGFAIGAASGATKIGHLIVNGTYKDKELQLDPLLEAAVGDTVQWPEAVGKFTLDTAQLRDALQFGLKRAP